MYLIVRTEKNKVVRYLLYLCQKKREEQETVKFSLQNTHSWARFFYHRLKMRAVSVGKFRCSCLNITLRLCSLRKQPTFGEATTGFPAKWRLRNETRNSRKMTRHYTDLGSASDWSCCVGNLIQPIRNTTQIWVVTRHQHGISALVSQSSFGGKTSGSIAKCRLFSQATAYIKPWAYTSS